MKHRWILWTFAAWSMWAIPLLTGAQGTVQAGLDSTEVLIGDEVRLTIALTLPKGFRLTRIAVDTFRMVRGLERRRALQRDSLATDQDVYYSQSFILSAFDSGYYRLPPVPVEVQTPEGGSMRLYSNNLSLMVRTIPVDPDSASIQPIKDIWKEPIHLSDIWWVVPAILGLLIAVLLWSRLRRKEVELEVLPKAASLRPAHEIALEKLHALQQSTLLAEGQFKVYQSELTFILKEYLSNRYQVSALESTTDDLEKLLPYLLQADQSWKNALLDMLRKADWVKFAKGSLSLNAHEAAWQQIYDFVQATKVQPVLPEDAKDASLTDETAP